MLARMAPRAGPTGDRDVTLMIVNAVAACIVLSYAVGFYNSYRTLDFASMGPQKQAAMKLGLLLWVGSKMAFVLMSVRLVQRFRAAIPGRRWRALGAWALEWVVIWMAVAFVFITAFTVIQGMR